MRPRFISAIYYEGRILLFEEFGDVYEYIFHGGYWCVLSHSPWPLHAEQGPTPAVLAPSITREKMAQVCEEFMTANFMIDANYLEQLLRKLGIEVTP